MGSPFLFASWEGRGELRPRFSLYAGVVPGWILWLTTECWRPGPKMNSQPIKLLLVEDEPVYAGLLQEMLRAVSPFELTAAGRFDEAMRQLGARMFDVVLLDLTLPDRK